MADLKKPFKHFDTITNFWDHKPSADSSNTKYITQEGAVSIGTPGILWSDFVLIHDIGQIWNRGRFYNYQNSYASLSKIAKKTFEPYDGAIISFLEEDGRSYFLTGNIFSAFKDLGIVPSLSIVPKFIDDGKGENSDGSLYPTMSIDDLYSLIDYECDIVNHSYSHDDTNIYKSSSSYDTIVSDLKKAEKWFVSHGIFTNCFSYPFNVTSTNIKNAVSRFEEYGVIYDGVNFLNDYKTDNLSFVKINLSDSNIAAVKAQIDLAITNKKWLIITTHSCGDASVDDLGSASIYGKLSSTTITNIVNYINTKTGFRYYTVSDALKVRASELNINGLKVYKDGDIALSEKAKDTIIKTMDFDKLTPEFKLKMLQYVISNWNKETGERSIIADKTV